MRYKILFLLFFLLGTNSYAQNENSWIVRKRGQLIDTIKGEIKINTSNNLKTISFRANQTTLFENYSAKQLLSFKMGNNYYESCGIEYDNASPDKNAMERLEYKPIMVKDTVFLKNLVNGKVTLQYFANDKFHFFVRKETSELVYLKYFVDYKGDRIIEKKIYQQQLLELLKDCDKVTLQNILDTKFTSDELAKLIKKYNECYNKQQYSAEVLKTKLVLGGLVGIAATQIQTNTTVTPRFINQSFSFDIQPTFGLSLLVILPTEKQRLMIYNEFSYRQFGGKSSANEYVNSSFYTINAIEMSFKQIRSLHSLRYSWGNKSLRPFVDAGFGSFLSLSYTNSWKTTRVLGSATPLENTAPLFNKGEVVDMQFLFWGGIGCFYKKISVALRYEHVPSILNLANVSSTTPSFSFVVGYHLKPF
jgi:hypothetical protein